MGTKCKGCCSCLLFIATTVFVYRFSLPVFLEGLDPEGSALPSDSREVPKMERSYEGGRHLICHTFQGGLGSLLFQYASATGIAASQGRIVVATEIGPWEEAAQDANEEDDEMFGAENGKKHVSGKEGKLALERILKTTNFKQAKTQCRSVVRMTESACCRYDERLMKLERGKNYELSGYLQSWKYFNEDLEQVRSLVVFKDAVMTLAKRKLSYSLAAANVSSLSNAAAVGVHVRRGDKLHWEAVDAGIRVAPREFFIKAMRHFRKNIQGPVVFLVVTDDPEWCRSNLVGLPGVVLVQKMKNNIGDAGLKRRVSAGEANVLRYSGGPKGRDRGLLKNEEEEPHGAKAMQAEEKYQEMPAEKIQPAPLPPLAKIAKHDDDTVNVRRVRRAAPGEHEGDSIYLDGTHHHNNRHKHRGDHNDDIDDEDGDLGELYDAAVDLAVLSLVDHSIISVGAFSWWAGFLARGTVVYYGNFVGPDSKMRSQFDDKMADYVLPGWIKLM